MREKIRTLVYLFYLFEVGLFLLLVPWSPMWERNYFLAKLPPLGSLCLSPFTRGAVSSVGILHLLQGALDSLAFVRAERR